MRNLWLFLLLFPFACFAQDEVQKDSVYSFKKLLDTDWNDSNRDFSFQYNKRNTFKYSVLFFHDEDAKLTRKYIYHNGEYDLRNVIPDFERRFFYDENLPVDYNSNATTLGGALIIGLFNSIFQ